MNTNVAIARLDDPTRNWVYGDPYIREALGAQVTRLLTGAAGGLPEYPTAAGMSGGGGGVPVLAREVVALADGAMWLYADEVARSIITPGSLGICHKCGDRGPIEGTFHVAWREVIVEFAFCVGCLASHVALATRAAEAQGVAVVATAVKGRG